MGCKVAFFEAIVVFFALCLVAYTSGAHATDYLASTAVFLGFIYSQMSFDLADAQPVKNIESPGTRMKKVYLLKEATWILTFGLLGSWPLLVGAIMFISYPSIRALTRAPIRQTLQAPAQSTDSAQSRTQEEATWRMAL